jgi:pantoate--beta-alanine ligase
VLDAAASASPPVVLDYLALVVARSFAEVGAGYRGPALLLVAAKVGATRLIDNIGLQVGCGPA